jgi:hypothetical protein
MEKDVERNGHCPIGGVIPDRFCLEGPNENHGKPQSKYQCSNQDLNRASPKCKPGALLCEFTGFAKDG